MDFAAAFWMIEPEIAFANLADDADLAEALLKHVFRTVLDGSGQKRAEFSEGTRARGEMRILIAEDDAAISTALVHALRRAGYAVDAVENGAQADAALVANRFDLLILDLGLPRLDGLEVLKRARAHKIRLPILILTARDSVEERVRGLDLGADDFLAKPFSLSELEARVRALMRRGEEVATPLLTLGNLKFDRTTRTAWIGERPVDLSARERAVLEELLRRPGRFVNKDQFVDGLCEWGDEVTSNAIEVYVHRLRKKLEGADVTITNTRGLGYCISAAKAE